MTEKYTPTTERVRDTWTNMLFEGGASDEAIADAEWDIDRSAAQFDRWLSEHDRQVAERAWDRGYDAGLERNGYHGPDLNPYRAEGEQ